MKTGWKIAFEINRISEISATKLTIIIIIIAIWKGEKKTYFFLRSAVCWATRSPQKNYETAKINCEP